MRIGITCYPTYGGSGIVATELGLELAARGHEIHFITYANPIRLGSGSEGVRYHEVEVSNYPLFQYPPYCLALASRMAEVAERHQLDLLHVHYAIPHSVSALLAKQMMSRKRRLPVVTTLHGTDITLVGAEASFFAITRFSIEQSDGVTAVSEYLARRTAEFFEVEKPVRVIRNFVNCSVYRPGPKARGQKVLLHVSNFRPVKRALDCIRILREVRREVSAELWMVGDGPDRSAAEKLSEELGLTEHVKFLGKQDQVFRLMPQAHVLLMPSEHEAFGLAALEAMACGVVPVATDCGGVAELITPGVHGYLERVGDVEGQARRVVRLLSDVFHYEQMALAARARAESRFDAQLVIPEYEHYYRELLE